jgi:hypothetical protein
VRYEPRLGWDDPVERRRSPRGAAAILVALTAILAAGLISSGCWVPVLIGLVAASSLLFLGEVAQVLPDSKAERYEVLVSTAPSWLVGEDDRDRDLSDEARADIRDEYRYPNDFAGMVVAVKESPAAWRPGDVASPNRQVIGLDLTPSQAAEIRGGGQKVDPVTYTLDTVTLADRYGATLPGLIEKFGSESAVEAADAEDVDEEFTSLKRALDKTITHTGAGLYEVGPTKTYSTIQSALDQLWTDQGSTLFSASQYIRVFADSYTENVTPNASFNPYELEGYGLIVEGDSGDDRANIDLTLVSGNGFYVNCDQCLIRHMTITGPSAVTYSIRTSSGCFSLEVDDCDVSCVANDTVISVYANVYVQDSHVTGTASTSNSLIVASRKFSTLKRSVITGPGKATSTVALVQTFACLAEACVFDGGDTGLAKSASSGYEYMISVNNTFYDCGSAVDISGGIDSQNTFINNIVKDCTQVFEVFTAMWPEETSTKRGHTVVQRNNCYHGYTNFGYDGSTSKTYAQWVAFNLVDADGDLDTTDPLLTNPGAGDFSLQSGSPCRNTGHGSGVVTDYLGTDFDPNDPDIGAWSSGVIGTITAPTWTANTSNISATDAGKDGDVDVTWDAATQAQSKDVGYVVERRTSAGPGAWVEVERSVDTSMRVSGLVNGTGYDFRVKAYARVEDEPTTTPVDTDSATPTGTGAATSRSSA